MEAVFKSLLAGFPILMLHSALTFAILICGVLVHVRITPYSDVKLVKEGNTAVAVTLGGAILGLAIPLAFCLASSVSGLDILVWGVVVVVLQLIAYKIADFILSDLPQRIENGEIGAAVFLVSIKLAVAAINAAAVVG